MLYGLLCVLVFVIIVNLLNIKWIHIFLFVGIAVLLIVWYAYPDFVWSAFGIICFVYGIFVLLRDLVWNKKKTKKEKSD